MNTLHPEIPQVISPDNSFTARAIARDEENIKKLSDDLMSFYTINASVGAVCKFIQLVKTLSCGDNLLAPIVAELNKK